MGSSNKKWCLRVRRAGGPKKRFQTVTSRYACDITITSHADPPTDSSSSQPQRSSAPYSSSLSAVAGARRRVEW
eukprot:1830760-Prymnesium_polylepis.2